MATLGQQPSIMSGRSPPLYWTLTLWSLTGIVCDTGSLFLPKCMYVWPTLSAEDDMDQPGVVVARTSSKEEVKRRENDTFHFSCPRSRQRNECRLALQVRRSRPASASRSFPTLKAECGAYLRESPSYSTSKLPLLLCSRVTCLRTGELCNSFLWLFRL